MDRRFIPLGERLIICLFCWMILVCLAAVHQTRVAFADSPTGQLGRLFFTPREREQLDILRDTGQPLDITGEKQTPAPPSIPDQIHVNGLLTRSRGKNVIWINGRSSPPSGVSPNLQQIENMYVPLTVLQNEKQLFVKPGQTLSPQTGVIMENFNN